MIAALRRHLDEKRYEADCLRRGRYPSLVAAHRTDLDAEDAPVFVFHTITACIDRARNMNRPAFSGSPAHRSPLAGIVARKRGRRVLAKPVC